MAIKKEDVFIGTIKRCDSLRGYNAYGDSRFAPEIEMRTMVIGTTFTYTTEIEKEAVLVRTKKGYLYIDLLGNFLERFLADIGIVNKVLQTKPSFDGDYFVDAKTLKPYFIEETNLKETTDKTSIHKLIKK